MDNADNGTFRHRLVALAELFDVKLSAARQALYFEALRDLSITAVVNALNQAAKTCKFFPKPAELRAFAVGDIEDQTETAWMAFRKAMARVGGYTSLVIVNATLGEAITAVFGSWPEACAIELTPEMWSAKRKEFGRVYRVLAGRSLDGVRYLPGICETQNAGCAEWRRFNPVAVLDGNSVRTLTAAEADIYRTAIAAERNELTRFDARALARLVPPSQEDSA